MVEFETVRPKSVGQAHRIIYQLSRQIEELVEENSNLKQEVYELKNRRD